MNKNHQAQVDELISRGRVLFNGRVQDLYESIRNFPDMESQFEFSKLVDQLLLLGIKVDEWPADIQEKTRNTRRLIEVGTNF